MCKTVAWVLFTAVLGVGIGPVAQAASPRDSGVGGASRDGDRIRRYEAQINQFRQELAKRSAEVEELAGQLEQTRQQLESTEQSLALERTTIAEYKERLNQAIARIRSTDERLDETQKKLAGARYQIRQLGAAKQSLQELSETRKNEILTCEEKNILLYQVSRELMEEYKNKGVIDSLLQQEPVTGLRQVEVENVLEEYRDKLDQHRYRPPAAALDTPETPVGTF